MDLLDPLLSRSITNLTSLVKRVAQTTANFKPELKLLSDTLEKISSIIQDIVNANRTLDRSEEECKMFKKEIEEAEKLVTKCSKVKRNIIKKFTYSLKLKDFNGKLLRFFQIEVQAIQTRDITETLLRVNDIKLKIDTLSVDLKDRQLRTSENSNDSGSMSLPTRADQSGSEKMKRGDYGWRVPALPIGIVAFDEPLTKLKAEVVAGIDIGDDGKSMDRDDRRVLVVAAAGGCGKTTLVKMLCHDPEILEKFGENIFFVTVSESPDFMVTVNDLFNPDTSKPQVKFQGIEDAKNKLENFVNHKVSGPMLLLLDDVWSDSFIDNFPSNNKRCKILVTSRTAFTNYDVFRFDPLTENDAKTLFCRSAFPDGGMRPSPVIDENLVNQMVACCKKHPFTLSVVGRSLNGKDKLIWESTLKELSQDSWSVLDLHKDVITSLQRSFEALDDDLKQCFLDFGLFPEDEKIPVSSLLNMWVHLYNHDDDGVDSLTKIFELSHRNLVDIMTTRNDSGARVNHYDQQYVIQHDLLRELAINLNNELPLVQRSRLIIDAQGEDLPASIEHVQEPIQARILSLCTGESFSSRWCDMEVPNLEVLILNLMSKTYTLPLFLASLQKLKILNITNHCLYPTQFNNFNLLTSSHNLTSIRLERVEISPSILSLINLQKVSFIMCKIGKSFKKLITTTPNIWPQLVEIEIDYCQDLLEFPSALCNSVHLKKISITNCNRMRRFNEEFGDLVNLEALSLRSCTTLENLPEEIWRLEKLSVIDISDCLSVSWLPEKIGKLGGLRLIYVNGCMGVYELPKSVEELSHVHVVCDEEIAYQWREYSNVEIHLVEDSVKTLTNKREMYGWRVPGLPTGIVAFNKPLAKLKAEVVAGIDRDDRSVLVVAAAGGCGKTTLVKMLCHDPDIHENFGENIFFVTVSETPNFTVIVNNLFNPDPSKPKVEFQSIEDAKIKLENFLNEKVSGPMLLVLDDVWSDSFIEEIVPSEKTRCQVLVTSRTAFTNYDVFQFDPMNENDAKTLFCRSAFPDGGMRPSPVIDENLVNQMVACCKRHPLTLCVVGRSLNGKDKLIWESTLKDLSRGSKSVLDLHKDVLTLLERSFEALDDDYKDYFLDFGLFPKDQRIPVSALLNMWVHLHNHDDDGVDTLAKIIELSYINLVDILATGFGNDSGARLNYCDQQFVTQHDLLRELSICLNSKLPLPQRSRLIINAREDFPPSIKQVREPMQARILSISTGESFTSQWCNIQVPDLEVLILNLMSKTYTLPQFLAGLPRLKILNITNSDIHPTQFNNFHYLTCSHNLTRIRLERVTISPFILSLVNLQKVSFIMCSMGNSFKILINETTNVWPQLVEIEIDYCQDLVEFPTTLCNSVHLKKISITNCNEMCGFSEEFGDLVNLETLSLRSCTKLEKLPESIWRLEKLGVLDISDCWSLIGLPEKMGELGSLRTIYMKGCTGVYELPESVEDLCNLRVVCNEEIAYQWREYSNVEIDLVEEDRLETLMRII